MNILTTLLQLFGNGFAAGTCAGGACTAPAAQAATEAVTATGGALGGISGLWGLLCKLFGLGC